MYNRRILGALSPLVVLLFGMTAVSQERYSQDFDAPRRSSDGSQRELRERPQTSTPSEGRSRAAREASIQGQVLRTKLVDVRGTSDKVLVALVKTDEGKQQIVDLGKPKSLRDLSVRSGDEIRAVGTSRRMGQRNVIFARRVTIDGTSANIERQRQRASGKSRLAGYKVAGKARLSGWIVDTRKARLKNSSAEHLIAQVRSRNGRRVVVDLGPAEKARQLDLQRNDGIGIAGFELQVKERPVILALRVRSDAGEELNISRAPSDANRSARR
jgi:hypothetical protein